MDISIFYDTLRLSPVVLPVVFFVYYLFQRHTEEMRRETMLRDLDHRRDMNGFLREMYTGQHSQPPPPKPKVAPKTARCGYCGTGREGGGSCKACGAP